MINITNKEVCCGCSACQQACPVQCISMVSDAEGFLYPKVDKSQCIGCGVCEKACLYLNNYPTRKPMAVLACKARDDSLRKASSSGGVFSLLAQQTINSGGVVYGAVLAEGFICKHTRAESERECKPLRGSKYIQSQLEDTFSNIKGILDTGVKVLFTGAPCQVSGLKHFLNRDYHNLTCVDFICHGVPSAVVLQHYLSELSQYLGFEITRVRFRTKAKGWKRYPLTVAGAAGDKAYIMPDAFMQGYSQALFLRPACYNCHANNFRSTSDLTMADYWGVNNVIPGFDDERGVSLLLINSDRGRDIYNQIAHSLETRPSKLKHALIFQPHLTSSSRKPKARDTFFNRLLAGEKFSILAKAYITSSPIYHIKNILGPNNTRRLQFYSALVRAGKIRDKKIKDKKIKDKKIKD